MAGEILDGLRRQEGRVVVVGRYKASASHGRVTLDQAAELSKLSRATVHRRITDGVVPGHTEPDGSLSIARKDVKLLRPREPSAGDASGRVGVSLRPKVDQHAAWLRAAGDKPLATWLGELADRAANYTEPQRAPRRKGR